MLVISTMLPVISDLASQRLHLCMIHGRVMPHLLLHHGVDAYHMVILLPGL